MNISNRNRIINFIKSHKRLVIVTVIYLITFIINQTYSPWHVKADKAQDFADLPSNSILYKIPAEFLFFGASELSELVSFSEDTYSSSGNSAFFLISACGLFSIMKIVQDLILEWPVQWSDYLNAGRTLPIEHNTGNWQEKLENSVVHYLFDNIFAYLCCIILYKFFDVLFPPFSEEHYVSQFMFRMFIAVPQIIQVMFYYAFVNGLNLGISHFAKALSAIAPIRNIIIFPIVILLIMGFNYVMYIIDELVMLLYKIIMVKFVHKALPVLKWFAIIVLFFVVCYLVASLCSVLGL